MRCPTGPTLPAVISVHDGVTKQGLHPQGLPRELAGLGVVAGAWCAGSQASAAGRALGALDCKRLSRNLRSVDRLSIPRAATWPSLSVAGSPASSPGAAIGSSP